MRKVPVLDDASVSRLCIQLLDRLRINVALCTEHDEVLYATRRTKEILRRFPDGGAFRTGDVLPPAVRDAAHAYLAPSDGQQRRSPIKLTTPDGAVVVSVACTPVHQLPPVALVLRLTEERVRTSEVLELMRARYKLSARDLRLLRAIAETRNVREIAEANSLTYGTTKVYLHDLYRRLDVHSRDGLLRLMDRVRRNR